MHADGAQISYYTSITVVLESHCTSMIHIFMYSQCQYTPITPADHIRRVPVGSIICSTLLYGSLNGIFEARKIPRAVRKGAWEEAVTFVSFTGNGLTSREQDFWFCFCFYRWADCWFIHLSCFQFVYDRMSALLPSDLLINCYFFHLVVTGSSQMPSNVLPIHWDNTWGVPLLILYPADWETPKQLLLYHFIAYGPQLVFGFFNVQPTSVCATRCKLAAAKI